MRKWTCLVIAASIASTVTQIQPLIAYAQEQSTPPHAATTIPASARYEIIQSHLAAKWTFRLDRVCGHVAQLIKSGKDDNAEWDGMIVFELPRCSDDGKVNYQIFSSSLAARHTFLMNLGTGETWQLMGGTVEGKEVVYWAPFRK